MRPVICLDCDGVLLDHTQAYALAWQKAFGEVPRLKHADGYSPLDRWDIPKLDGSQLAQLRACFDDAFWRSLPAIAGALESCQILDKQGFELVCVTALPNEFRAAREHNLKTLGFPIAKVMTTGNAATGSSPKATFINECRPKAFVDDYLPFFAGVDDRVHKALITRNPVGSPNVGERLREMDSLHSNLAEFASWWLGRS